MKTKIKIQLFAFILLLACACLVSACQPTPVKPVVVNKNDGKIEKKIEETPLPVKKYEAPESWRQDYSIYDGRIKFEVDASVTLPDVEKYPVLKLEPGKITQEMADKAFAYLFGDKTVYEPQTQETKAQLTEFLLEEKAKYAKLKKKAKPGQTEVELVEGSSSQMVDLKDMEAQIKELEKQVQEAPEKVERKLLKDRKFKTMERGQTYIAGEADFGNKYPASLWVNGGSPEYPYHSLSFFNDGDSIGTYLGKSNEPPGAKEFTEEDAVKKTQDFLDTVGIRDMKVAFTEMQCKWKGNDPADDKVIGYKICYTRAAEGIQVAYNYEMGEKEPERINRPDSPSDLVKEKPIEYRPALSRENMSMIVTPEEIRVVEWYGVSEAGDIINENVELLPFDEIMSRFEQMASVKYAYITRQTEADVKSAASVNYIDDIVLGYARVPVKDRLDEYTLQPVWCFYGGYKSSVVTYKNGKTKEWKLPNPELASRRRYCMLTINAIDGSILEYDR